MKQESFGNSYEVSQQELEVSLLRTDGGTQPRAGLDEGHLQDLVETLERGGKSRTS